jgi:hypothetical protein
MFFIPSFINSFIHSFIQWDRIGSDRIGLDLDLDLDRIGGEASPRLFGKLVPKVTGRSDRLLIDRSIDRSIPHSQSLLASSEVGRMKEEAGNSWVRAPVSDGNPQHKPTLRFRAQTLNPKP